MGRLHEYEIGLAWQYAKAQSYQFLTQILPGRNDLAEIRAVILQIGERRLGGNLAQAVDIVAIANLLQRRDQFGMADEISDALEAERVSLGERARNQDLRMFQRERQRILVGEIHIGFIEHHHAPMRLA